MIHKPSPLSPRLMSIASFVQKGAKIADIGTDHARLPIYLLQNGVIASAIASDVREGPLEKATENLKYFGFLGHVSLRLADGFAGIKDYEANLGVVAGMGGEVISNILKAGLPRGIQKLILQPMTDVMLARKTITGLGFKITNEDIVKESNKMYIIIVCEKGASSLKENELLVTPFLKEHPLYKEYLEYKLKRMEKAALMAEKAGAETELTYEYNYYKYLYNSGEKL